MPEPASYDVLGEEVAAALDRVTQAHIDGNSRDQSFFHPSTIGYCPRKTVMERLGVPGEAISVRTQRIFENGHYVHARILKDLKEAGILVLDEVPVDMIDANCHGHTDGIGKVVFAQKGGVMIILEIKSAGAKSYHWMAGGKLPGDKVKTYSRHGPDPKHVEQVQLYMYMTGIQYAVILVECKDCQERAMFTVKLDRELVATKLLPKIALVNAHVDAKTLPPRDRKAYPKTGFDCTWCPYKEPCAAQEASGVVVLPAA